MYDVICQDSNLCLLVGGDLLDHSVTFAQVVFITKLLGQYNGFMFFYMCSLLCQQN